MRPQHHVSDLRAIDRVQPLPLSAYGVCIRALYHAWNQSIALHVAISL